MAPNWPQPLALATKITLKWTKNGPKWPKKATKGPPKYCMVILSPNVLKGFLDIIVMEHDVYRD